MTTIDTRELMLKDYSLMDTEQLEALKSSIMHSIQHAEAGLTLWHREYTQIRIELAKRNLATMEALEPQHASATDGDPEYSAWVERGQG